MTVNGTPPVFENVNDKVVNEFLGTFPNASEVGEAARCAGATPVPVSRTVTLPALLVTTKLPLEVVCVVGVKLEVTLIDAPAASVALVAGKPVAEKGVVGAVFPVNFNETPPGFERVTVTFAFTLVPTEPKLTEAGVATSCAGATPVPVIETVAAPPFVTTVSDPLDVTCAEGAKTMGATHGDPLLIVPPTAGSPVTLKGAVGIVMLVTVIAGVPLSLSVMD